MSTTTEIVPAYVERGKVALKEGKSLKEIASEVLDDLPAVVTTEVVPFPPVPKPLVITDEHRVALAELSSVFGVVQPDTRRTLTPDEITTLYKERECLKTIGDLLDGREEAIKTLIRHHLDVDAETRGVAVPKAKVDGATGEVIVEPSPRDQHGHYVLATKGKPERLPIPGTNQEWSREYRSGSVEVDTERLEALLAAGEISREDYLSFTREVRVFDEDRAREAMKKDPSRFALLRRISRRSSVGSSLFVRKAQ